MRVRASGDFIISLALIFFLNSFSYACLFILAACLHESGHLALLKIFKIKKPELNLGLLGANIRADTSSLSYRQETAIYLGGALFNFITCAVCLIAMRFLTDMRLIFFFFANLFYACLNLLPIKTLDGGRAVECCLLHLSDDPWRAESICRRVSFVFSTALVAASLVFLMRCKSNLTLVLLLVWIVFSAYSQNPLALKLRRPQQRRRSRG